MQTWVAVVLSLLWLGTLAVVHWWPATYWMEVRSVSIAGDLTLTVDRTIKREFQGAWVVSVRRWNGGWEQACASSGESLYRSSRKLPERLDLDWWTRGACKTLTPGKYRVSTAWTIRGAGVLPDKILEIDSNTFEVPP